MNRRYPLVLLAAVLAMAAARAWTSDDAFITYRVVEQWLSGQGPVFNAGERVQVFTHPLWFLVLALWSGSGASLFPGVMWLSLALFGAALASLYVAWRDKPVGLAVVAVAMAFSPAIVDFATSGLETALTFALFAAACAALRHERPRVALCILALLPLNRFDLLPWAAPFAWIAARPGPRARLGALATLCAPAAAWIVFSTIYYGAPLPNTAYAKLGDDALARLDRGAAYVAASLVNDPGALALVVVGLALGLRAARATGVDARIAAASIASAAIGAAYAVWAGGDFMLGRFLLPVLWAMVAAILASIQSDATCGRRDAAFAVGIVAAALFVTGQSTSNLWIGMTESSPQRIVWLHGAVDERRFYLPALGAWSPARFDRVAQAPLAAPQRPVGPLGLTAYRHPGELIVDVFALADPFLARIAPLPGQRSGHALRPAIPDFMRWRDAAHTFGDARLDALAADLRLAHRSPELWSLERWRAIARLAVMHPIVVADPAPRHLRHEIAFAWVGRIADWLEERWPEKPKPAIAAGFVLLLVSAWLRRAQRRDAGTPVTSP
jgi:arabinofuranosyltransferase